LRLASGWPVYPICGLPCS